jgi:hypothetical protein
MAATCALSTPPDLFRVCNKGPWIRRPTHLRFLFAGKNFACVTLDAMLLDAPFTHVKDDHATLPPPPEVFPDGIEAARIHACPIGSGARAISLVDGTVRYVSAQYRHFYIDLAGPFEEYLRKFSSKSRCTLRRKLKKFLLAAGAEQPFLEFSRPEEMARFQHLAAQVSRQTYQHRLLGLSIPDGEQYLRELSDLAAEDRLRGYILMQRGTPVAYNLCVGLGSTLTLDKTGFDPEFAGWHPGTVLQFLTIERLYAEQRFRIYDFGSGDFRYKEFFATGSVRCADILYLRRSLRILAVVAAHHALDFVSDGLKGILDAVGLKDRVKKLLHYGI